MIIGRPTGPVWWHKIKKKEIDGTNELKRRRIKKDKLSKFSFLKP